MAYCLISDVKDKTIDDILNSAQWVDADIQARIDEGATIIDSKILALGFTQNQLSVAPLIKQINILYARYAILRDIYSRISPSKTDEKGFVKWKEEALDLLEKISNMQLILVDSNGIPLLPSNITISIVPKINTIDTKRIFNLTTTKDWKLEEESYSDESVIGKK